MNSTRLISTLIAIISMLIYNTSFITANGDSEITWHEHYAHKCKFVGRRFQSVKSASSECGPICLTNLECSHFNWANGMCHLRKGPVSKGNAIFNGDVNTVCGISREEIDENFNKTNINWKSNNWAFGCYFNGNDLFEVKMKGEYCGVKCENTPRCTHFNWNITQGGTCYLKTGPIAKDQAIRTKDLRNVCGYNLKNLKTDDHFNIEVGEVLATKKLNNKKDVCSLPLVSYEVKHPIGVTEIDRMFGNLRPVNANLCGQVFTINCGHGELDVIAVDKANSGSGLSMHPSTWKLATNGSRYGQSKCSVKLSRKSALDEPGPICFYSNAFLNTKSYLNVGLINTNGKLVVEAQIDELSGQRLTDDFYFSFSKKIVKPDRKVIFKFHDGSNYSVKLSFCQKVLLNKNWN